MLGERASAAAPNRNKGLDQTRRRKKQEARPLDEMHIASLSLTRPANGQHALILAGHTLLLLYYFKVLRVSVVLVTLFVVLVLVVHLRI